MHQMWFYEKWQTFYMLNKLIISWYYDTTIKQCEEIMHNETYLFSYKSHESKLESSWNSRSKISRWEGEICIFFYYLLREREEIYIEICVRNVEDAFWKVPTVYGIASFFFLVEHRLISNFTITVHPTNSFIIQLLFILN